MYHFFIPTTYADRIVEFRDGEIVSDSNPPNEKQMASNYSLKKTSMNFFTALKLSGKNIATKKWRTALTAFASSIGIIGIALVLSLSNGFNKQISSFESDTLSGFSIMITQTTAEIDKSSMKKQRNEMLGISKNENKYPDTNFIYPYDPSEKSMIHKNVFNDDYYVQKGDYFVVNGTASNLIDMYNSKNAITLNIVGIIRASEDTKLAVLSEGIAYSDELSLHFIENAKNSKIVRAQQEADYNVLTGEAFSDASSAFSTSNPMRQMNSTQGASSDLSTKESVLSFLGANGTPNLITLYPTDFNAKEGVLERLNAWNEGRDVKDTVVYTDMASTFTSLAGGIMDAITLVLVAFAAISLVVSLIMIGIITYISVLERTKEIGVLRALGARKKDITRVFNAETFIIGSCSGLLGILIAYLLTIPINILLKRLTELTNVSQLNPLHATILVIISVLLTMLGGLIPARIAAKKDPVEALRTE